MVGFSSLQPAVSSSGAVSPTEIAIAMSNPVTIPGTAALNMILRSAQPVTRTSMKEKMT